VDVHSRGDNPPVLIREASAQDWASIWPFYRAIVAAGETYAIDPEITSEAGQRQWMQAPPGQTFVATDDSGTVIGSASVYPNRGGNGAHVASASFMIDPSRAGRGVGRALGERVLEWARDQGYRAMQFNAVVETNERAVHLWKSLGFEVLTSVPEAFRHPIHGYVGLLIMYRYL
jgi:L-amino acid N-acyltransferase YncA